MEQTAIKEHKALKEELFSKEPFLKEDDKKAFLALGNKIRSHFKPENHLEHLLVDKLVAGFWRNRRLLGIEKELLEDSFTFYDENGKEISTNLSQNFTRNDELLEKLAKAEKHIDECNYKIINQLNEIKRQL